MKIWCAYKRCRSRRCVKNIGKEARAARTDVNADLCRYLHPAAQVVRFCGRAHRKLCCSAADAMPRGQREALDLEQYSVLFYTTVRLGAPWAAALTTLQLVCGERADCARQARAGWLQHIDPSDDHPPTVRIPKVNGKTKAREIPLAPAVAALLHEWMTQGLRCPGGTQRWPFSDDPNCPQTPRRLLFPGKALGRAKGRDWARPVTVRGYRSKLAEAAAVLQRQRATSKRRGVSHPFDGFPLDRLGTHSFKRSSVSLMKDTCTSTALCGAIAGTTAKTLDRVYDMPTLKRQQALVVRAFEPVAAALQDDAALPPRAAKRAKKKPGLPAAAAPPPPPPPQQGGAREEKQGGASPARFCAACGKLREDPSWAWCPWCGHVF